MIERSRVRFPAGTLPGSLNLAFHPSGVGKSSTGLLAGVKEGRVHLCRVGGNTLWSQMASDASYIALRWLVQETYIVLTFNGSEIRGGVDRVAQHQDMSHLTSSVIYWIKINEKLWKTEGAAYLLNSNETWVMTGSCWLFYNDKENNIMKLDSTQRAQTSAERQHNRIAEWFLQCKFAMQLWSESTRYFFDNPVNSDFGLLDPDGDPDRHQNLITWSLPFPEISSKSVHIFFSYPTDRQTDRQTDRCKNITSFFGGGN